MPEAPKKTPLDSLHRSLGAKIVLFAGYNMPVSYSGVIDEHMAVRTDVGLFDVSHMGEFEVTGPDALSAVDALTPNAVASLADGEAHYSALLTERGTFVDDILVYRRALDRIMLVVNAANIAKDFLWVKEHLRGDASLVDRSLETALIACQGPGAAACLASIASFDPADLAPFSFIDSIAEQTATVASVNGLVSRTGYTGEDGFEIYLSPERAETVFGALLEAGAKPCGLAARDTLRLEARLPLYGNDIDDERTPLEAGLGFIVKLKKGDFIGRDALVAEKERGVAQRLRGFEMLGRQIARHGYPVQVEGKTVATVTSGSFAPFLKKRIGLCYLPAEQAALGGRIQVEVRGRAADAEIVRTPFYRRKKS